MKTLKQYLLQYLLMTVLCMCIGVIFLLPACFSKEGIKTYQSTTQQTFWMMNAGSKDPCLRLYNAKGDEIGDISGLTAKGNICHFFPQDEKVKINAVTVVEGIWIQRILLLDVDDDRMKRSIRLLISPQEQRLYAFKTYVFFVLFFPILLFFVRGCYYLLQVLFKKERI